MVHGDDPALDKRTAEVPSLQSYLEDHYGPWVIAHRKAGNATLARIRAHFSVFFNVKLSDLSPLIVDRWRTKRLASGLQPATLNRDLVALRSALSKAVEWGLVPAHPLQSLKMAKIDSASVVRFLSEKEEGSLRSALDQREQKHRENRSRANEWRRARGYPEFTDISVHHYADYLKPMVLISINTGLRQGELFNLSWKSVDLERSNLTIAGQTAKSGKTRHIPLNAEALDALRRWRMQSVSTTGFVFPSANGKPFDNVKKAWQGLLDHAAVEHFRWHDMRHHFASRLVMAGVDLNTVRELLGHGDIKMTLRYAHLAPEHKAAAVEKLVSSFARSKFDEAALVNNATA